MTSELSEYIEKVGNSHQMIRVWIKDFTLPLEKSDLSEDIRLVLCKNVLERKNEVLRGLMKSGKDENGIIVDMCTDIIGMTQMLGKYLENFVIDYNLPECLNQPPYKRDLIYVLVGALSMMNDNLYTYRVSNFKYKLGSLHDVKEDS